MTSKIIIVVMSIAVLLLGVIAMMSSGYENCNYDQWIGGFIFVLAVLMNVAIAVAVRFIMFRCKYDSSARRNGEAKANHRPRRSDGIGQAREYYGTVMVEASLPDQAEPFQPAHHSARNSDRDSDGETELGFETANDRPSVASITATTTRSASSRPFTGRDPAPGPVININITNIVNNYNR